MSKVTPELLTELKRLEASATPGPWKCSEMPRDILGADGRPVCSTAYPHTVMPRDQRIGMKDAQFITVSVNALPSLLAHITDLESSIAKRDKALEVVRDYFVFHGNHGFGPESQKACTDHLTEINNILSE